MMDNEVLLEFVNEFEVKGRGTALLFKLNKPVSYKDLIETSLGTTITHQGAQRKVIGVERMGTDDRLTTELSLLVN